MSERRSKTADQRLGCNARDIWEVLQRDAYNTQRTYLELTGDLGGLLEIRAPDAGAEPKLAVVCSLHSLRRR